MKYEGGDWEKDMLESTTYFIAKYRTSFKVSTPALLKGAEKTVVFMNQLVFFIGSDALRIIKTKSPLLSLLHNCNPSASNFRRNKQQYGSTEQGDSQYNLQMPEARKSRHTLH